jgi:hypothetical protein
MKYFNQYGARFSSILLLALAGACAPHFEMHTARDFIVLDESDQYDFRATTPDGLVIAVREFDNNRERGELDFWVKAIENQLRLDGGYALLDSKPITTKRGLLGTQLRFGLDREAEAHVYIVTVFVTERGTIVGKKSRVYVIEAGGREAHVKRHQAQLDWSVAEFVGR